MGLIRSEHANDQAVVAAKEQVAAMDRELEEARTRLENRERKQYHEEQIWSDTIRRNSTWITFVLMGFNILLLLTTTAVIEPWRRRRMVREIKAALEEQNLLRTSSAPLAVIEKEIDEAIEPVGVPLEVTSEAPVAAAVATEPTTPTEEIKADETLTSTVPEPEILMSKVPEPAPEVSPSEATKPTLADQAKISADQLKHQIQELFSEKPITVRKVDVTTVALEGAVVGAGILGLLMLLLKPR
jgi:sensitive to high expression protein 9